MASAARLDPPVCFLLIRLGVEGQFARHAAHGQRQRQRPVGQHTQRLAAIVPHIPALGLEGVDLVHRVETVDVVPVLGQGDAFRLVQRQAEGLLRRLVNFRKLVAAIRVRVAGLHQRLHLEVVDAGQVDQAAQGPGHDDRVA